MSICSFHCFALWLSSSPNRQPTKYIEQVLFKSKKRTLQRKIRQFFVFDSQKHKIRHIFFFKKGTKIKNEKHFFFFNFFFATFFLFFLLFFSIFFILFFLILFILFFIIFLFFFIFFYFIYLFFFLFFIFFIFCLFYLFIFLFCFILFFIIFYFFFIFFYFFYFFFKIPYFRRISLNSRSDLEFKEF